ncbi:prepilin-type N-terminal cleavage/methylation domain-containing protein [Nostoc sp. T09]|uniref:hormogonium polysaccharide secretion pseudopilin HpsB n=1 Tax=Nostoc sp. T09 TaxID=1932621 RepID=UPI000A3B6865|nr:hormogonium polysaccharide secretion pseudopilin HpsB [Nostoc sp. T09]OUL37620.1 prepilin-type N-terminal cleavage/methylation domain-containing protein [Nostoc sp. T09]
MIKHKQQPKILRSNESGFTIIESLIAMLVAAVLLTAIAPVIVLATASRVQARRIELGTQAARTYIDGVRTGAITSPVSTSTGVTLDGSDPPTVGSLTCSANAYCTVPATPANNLYCIDGDGNGSCTVGNSKDLLVQAFRYNTASTNANTGYQLGVRVYRADGFDSNGNLKKAPSKQATFTGGIGDRKAPLVEMTTAIASQTSSFNDLCNRLKVTGSTTSNTTCN